MGTRVCAQGSVLSTEVARQGLDDCGGIGLGTRGIARQALCSFMKLQNCITGAMGTPKLLGSPLCFNLYCVLSYIHTHLASIHNQNFLFIVGKKIVICLATANNQVTSE
ncbi:hypothetical protein QTP70_018052 [Hemibagrus guttatus]|uniref:Uncharacterized protein n=1 Tax=Hemibagrus guttatus TaxID=175788 RepID=A0AAE0UHF4_9TELE|nr:hypothetical protein QTP70_018052 [Hemibagrus guttatus]